MSLTVVQAHQVVEVMGWTGADAEVVFLRDRVFFRQNALLGFIVEFDGTANVSADVW